MDNDCPGCCGCVDDLRKQNALLELQLKRMAQKLVAAQLLVEDIDKTVNGAPPKGGLNSRG